MSVLLSLESMATKGHEEAQENDGRLSDKCFRAEGRVKIVYWIFCDFLCFFAAIYSRPPIQGCLANRRVRQQAAPRPFPSALPEFGSRWRLPH